MQHHSLFTTTSLVPLRSLPHYVKKTLHILSLAGALILANPIKTHALLDGVTVTAGNGNSTIVGATQNLNQASLRAVFEAMRGGNIASGETLQFNHASLNSSTLLRIHDANPTQILGAIKAGPTANIYLINPNGMIFGSGAQVNVGSLITSTADISNNDFMAGKKHFNIASPNKNAKIDIQSGANITVAEGGVAAFFAPAVHNDGVIQAKAGSVALVSGQTAILDFYGDGLINLKVTKEVDQVPIDPSTGAEVDALVTNSGKIIADGGTVVLTAEAAQNVIDNVINMSGTIRAQTATKHGEVIIFGGKNGKVDVSGTIDASGQGSGQKGGVVHVLSENSIHIRGTASIDASGDAGGGTINIGGEFRGSKHDPSGKDVVIASKNSDKASFGQPTDIHYIKDRDGSYTITTDPTIFFTGDIPQAQGVTIDRGSQFKVNANNNGDGGKAIFWSPDTMNFFSGRVDASAGPNGGDAGFIEISGKKVLNLAIDSADTLLRNHPKGKDGMVLFDPDGTIGAAEAAALVATLAGGDATFAVTGLLTIAADIITATTNTLFLEGRTVLQSAGIDISLGPAGRIEIDYNIPTSDPGFAVFSMADGATSITAGSGIRIEAGLGNGGTTLGGNGIPGTFDSGTSTTTIGAVAGALAPPTDLVGASFTASVLNIEAPLILSAGNTFPSTGNTVNLAVNTMLFGTSSPTFPNLTTAPFTPGGTFTATGTGDFLVDGTHTASGNTSLSFDTVAVTGTTTVPSGTTLTVTTTDFDSESGGYSFFNGTKNVTTDTFFVQSGGTPMTGTGFLDIIANTVNPSIEALVLTAEQNNFGGTIDVNGTQVYPRDIGREAVNDFAEQVFNLINRSGNQTANTYTGVWQTDSSNNSNDALANLRSSTFEASGFLDSFHREGPNEEFVLEVIRVEESSPQEASWFDTRPDDPAAEFGWHAQMDDNATLGITYTQNGEGFSGLYNASFGSVPPEEFRRYREDVFGGGISFTPDEEADLLQALEEVAGTPLTTPEGEEPVQVIPSEVPQQGPTLEEILRERPEMFETDDEGAQRVKLPIAGFEEKARRIVDFFRDNPQGVLFGRGDGDALEVLSFEGLLIFSNEEQQELINLIEEEFRDQGYLVNVIIEDIDGNGSLDIAVQQQGSLFPEEEPALEAEFFPPPPAVEGPVTEVPQQGPIFNPTLEQILRTPTTPTTPVGLLLQNFPQDIKGILQKIPESSGFVENLTEGEQERFIFFLRDNLSLMENLPPELPEGANITQQEFNNLKTFLNSPLPEGF